jgi:hypothetical protein
MNVYGWTVMLVSIGFVVSLASWCYYRVLTLPPLEEGEQL